MPRQSNWRARLYDCPSLKFPAFARLRLIKEHLEWTNGDMCDAFGSQRSSQTIKNILDGKVTSSPKRLKGWSSLTDEMLQSFLQGLETRGHVLPRDALFKPMSEDQFLSGLGKWFRSPLLRPSADTSL
jgi:hypothetical protein